MGYLRKSGYHKTTPYRNDRKGHTETETTIQPPRAEKREKKTLVVGMRPFLKQKYGEMGGGVVLSLRLSPGWFGGGPSLSQV